MPLTTKWVKGARRAGVAVPPPPPCCCPPPEGEATPCHRGDIGRANTTTPCR